MHLIYYNGYNITAPDPLVFQSNWPKMVANQAYNQVFHALKEQILGCSYAPGQKIPAERLLCQQFSVSRITVRHALRLLQEQGLLERFRGRGTFVRSLKPKKIPILNHDFTGSVRSQAPNMKRTLLARMQIVPPTHIADSLKLEPSQPCSLAIRLDSLFDEPLAYDRLYVPLALAASFDEDLLASIDFLELWLEREKIELSNCVETLEAMEADAQSVEYLGVAPGSAILLATDICYDSTGRAIALFESVYRGDRIKLISTTYKGRANVKTTY